MGVLRSLLTGRPDPLVEHAFTASADNIIDGDSIDPAVFGLTSYADPVSPAPRIDRHSAMQVPAVKRVRDLIAGGIGGLPVDLVAPDRTVGTCALFVQPERDVPRSVTMTRLVEDMLFEGRAWWRITASDWRGFPTQVVRLHPRTVDVRNDGRVYHRPDGSPQGLADEWIPDDQLIRFESPTDGLLIAGARAIRTCLQLDAAAMRFSEGVPPNDYFAPADGIDLDDEEVTGALNAWKTARQTRATGYIPAALEYHVNGFNPEQLQMAEARQHAVLEIARLSGVDPEDLGVSTTSRTYQNSQDRGDDLIRYTLGQYLHAIEDRLGMNDVCPRGSTARINLGELRRANDLQRFQGYQVGLQVGALDAQMIADAEGNPRVIEAPKPAPALPSGAGSDDQEADPVAASSRLHAVENFDDTALTFDAPASGETFAVDAEKRVIRGLAVPYGTVSNDGRTFSFSKGSIQLPDDPGRVKLLIGHDWNRAVGKAIAFKDTDAGLVASFKVARGPAGDEALSMAEDGVWDGLSVGIGQGMKTRAKDGVLHVLSAPLREISQTPAPAYAGARITEVAASNQEGSTMTDTSTEAAPVAEPVDFASQLAGLGDSLTQAISQGFEGLQFPQRETVSASGGGRIEVSEPSPYRFDGLSGEHSFTEDMFSAFAGSNDQEAKKRIEVFMDQVFNTATTDVGTLNTTQNRPDLYVPNLTYTTPLWDLVSTGSITDKTPFTVPKFGSSSGLVGNHTEGVEPTPGTFTATSQTVTPAPLSGKVRINREVIDQGGSPQADAIIWNEMLNAWYEAREAKIASLLNGLTLTEVNFAGAADAALVNAVVSMLVNLQYQRGGNRYTAFALDGSLFAALINAADSSGRKLLPVLGPANAQGTVTGAFDSVAIGNLTGKAAWALGSGNAANSYLFVPASVWAWASAPRKFNFEYQVATVDMAIWGYMGTASLRDSDVKRLDLTTADS